MTLAPCAHVWWYVDKVVVIRRTVRGVSHKEGRRYLCGLCGRYETRLEKWQD